MWNRYSTHAVLVIITWKYFNMIKLKEKHLIHHLVWIVVLVLEVYYIVVLVILIIVLGIYLSIMQAKRVYLIMKTVNSFGYKKIYV
jgi:hypothetical protein